MKEAFLSCGSENDHCFCWGNLKIDGVFKFSAAEEDVSSEGGDDVCNDGDNDSWRGPTPPRGGGPWGWGS